MIALVRKIIVKPHDENWQELFSLEKERLTELLGDHVLSIHHIGSTAIPNTKAKHEPPDNGGSRITRTIISDLNETTFPSAPVVPFGKPVHDRLRLEISRGCTRGCRFCQAGMIYRPVRERSPQSLLDLSAECIRNTGYDDISLLSLSSGDYSCIGALITDFMHRYRSRNIAISLPSLRVGTLTPQIPMPSQTK